MSAASPAAPKWVDLAESSDEDEFMAAIGHRTNPDGHGQFVEIEYAERDGKTYKVAKHMKQTVSASWTNRLIEARKEMKKFGKAAAHDQASERPLAVRSEEDIPIELSRRLAAHAFAKDEAGDAFHEWSLSVVESMNQPRRPWTEATRRRQIERHVGGAERPDEPGRPGELREMAFAFRASDAPRSTYVPPALRGRTEGDQRGDGRSDVPQQQEASLRVTNLSEDCREGDLQDLFGQVGRLQRVYLAKDQTTGLARGFAFVTYYTREDAQKAIKRLHGHGYDNLILQVQFAKPRG